MPDLSFRVAGVEPAARGLTPLLHFNLGVSNAPATEEIHGVLLQAQIHIESAQRPYDYEEKKRLVDLFGTPDRWGQTLRTRLWSHASVTVRPFIEMTDAILPVPCTYDLSSSLRHLLAALVHDLGQRSYSR